MWKVREACAGNNKNACNLRQALLIYASHKLVQHANYSYNKKIFIIQLRKMTRDLSKCNMIGRRGNRQLLSTFSYSKDSLDNGY